LKRGETSGRTDDNPESLRKRFQTYINHTLPIIKHYEGQEKVRTVKCDEKMTPDQVCFMLVISKKKAIGA